MASSTFASAPAFSFGDNKENAEAPKIVENPLLLRNSPATGQHSPSHDAKEISVANGLRQRRKPDKSESSIMAPPPRASFSLGTGVDSIPVDFKKQDSSLWERSSSTAGETKLVPSTTGCWVLVYGYASAVQYDEILRRFADYGHILDHRGSCQPGRSNWIAVQYESRLQAEKALCHQHIQLTDGIYCGVKRLDDKDPILLQTADNALSDLWTKTGSSAGGDSVLPHNLDMDGARVSGGLEEKDILLTYETPAKLRERRRSLCERLVRWVLSVSD